MTSFPSSESQDTKASPQEQRVAEIFALIDAWRDADETVALLQQSPADGDEISLSAYHEACKERAIHRNALRAALLKLAGQPVESGRSTPTPKGVQRFTKKPVTIEAITFDELVAHGLAHCGLHQHNGMPWSFEYKGQPITHGDDNCYMIPTANGYAKLRRGDMLCCQEVNGRYDLWPVAADIFAATYSPESVVADAGLSPHQELSDEEIAAEVSKGSGFRGNASDEQLAKYWVKQVRAAELRLRGSIQKGVSE